MYLVLLQTQSTGGAALEIIVMLLGAAIIGVLTTYFYMKSVYGRRIKDLELKLEAAERAKDQLNAELDTAQKELSDVKLKLEELEKKYNDLMTGEETPEKGES